MDCFVGECAAAADDADVSLLVNAAGHDADFAFTWRNDARAVGPMRRVFLKFTTEATRTISITGIPSVMHTTRGRPASAASRMASAAYAGGTKITEAFAPVALAASATVLKTGRSKCFVPPLPGVTPP